MGNTNVETKAPSSPAASWIASVSDNSRDRREPDLESEVERVTGGGLEGASGPVR
jgi:hypothetical protein